MSDKRIHNIFLILLVVFLLSITVGHVNASFIASYPGGSDEIDTIIEIFNGSNHFYPPQAARFFLSQIKYWEAEAPHLNVSEPNITIVDHYINAVYQYSELEASVPFHVHKDAPVGDYKFTLTFFDRGGSSLLNVTGTVRVCSSEMTAKLTNLGFLLWIFGMIAVFLILVVIIYSIGEWVREKL